MSLFRFLLAPVYAVLNGSGLMTMEPPVEDVTAVLDPFLPVHLGILTRCHLLSPAAVRALDAQRLLRQSFGVEFSTHAIEEVYRRLQLHCPQLLGGEPIPLNGLLGETTLILPTVTSCPTCDVTLLEGQPAEAKAFFLHQGWTSVRWSARRCPTCNDTFSSIWRKASDDRTRCCAVCSPEDATFLQIVACPRKNSKAFIETRVLWLLRAAVVRAKTGFSGFVDMLADLHGVPSDRQNDVYRFEHRWLLLEILTLLWEHAPHVAQTTYWPLDTKHAARPHDSFHGNLLASTQGICVLCRYFEQ